MSINSFMSNFSGGGYRPNKFKVEIDGIDGKLEFHCRSASIPETTIGKIEIPYQGQVISVAGDVPSKEWTLEIFMDTDFKVRKDFELWMESIRPQEIVGGTDTIGYIRTGTVDLLGSNQETLRSYKMLRCFPTNLGEITLSHDTVDTIGMFTVTLSISGWTSL